MTGEGCLNKLFGNRTGHGAPVILVKNLRGTPSRNPRNLHVRLPQVTKASAPSKLLRRASGRPSEVTMHATRASCTSCRHYSLMCTPMRPCHTSACAMGLTGHNTPHLHDRTNVRTLHTGTTLSFCICYVLRRAQPRLISANFVCVILAGSSICRTKPQVLLVCGSRMMLMRRDRPGFESWAGSSSTTCSARGTPR